LNILLNDKHELLSGWKFLAFVILFLIFWVASGIAISVIYIRSNLPDSELILIYVNEFALASAAIGALFISIRYIDHRPAQTFGIGLIPDWRRHLALGLTFSAGMLGALLAGCLVVGFKGRVTIEWSLWRFPASTTFGTLGLLLLAAATEELVFRGFPLQILVEGIGPWPAVIAMSALFGAAHRSNPDASLLSVANTALAGVLLSWAYVRSRSLWLSYGIHVGWNLGLGFIFGFPLSGLHLASLWTIHITGADTILGGAYGPEAGFLATVIFGGSAVIVSTSTKILPNNRAYHGAGEHQLEE
jgi:membrane protease YdiL (CAAX protease family)